MLSFTQIPIIDAITQEYDVYISLNDVDDDLRRFYVFTFFFSKFSLSLTNLIEIDTSSHSLLLQQTILKKK